MPNSTCPSYPTVGLVADSIRIEQSPRDLTYGVFMSRMPPALFFETGFRPQPKGVKSNITQNTSGLAHKTPTAWPHQQIQTKITISIFPDYVKPPRRKKTKKITRRLRFFYQR